MLFPDICLAPHESILFVELFFIDNNYPIIIKTIENNSDYPPHDLQ